MKVLHGMSEVAGQGIYSVKGLRANGVYAKIAVWRRNNFGYDCDYDLKIGKCKILYPYYAIKMLFFAVYAIFKFDCFHFHFGWSLIPGGFDLKLLRLFRKKVFMEFHGSDIRWSFNRDKYDNLPLPEDSERRKRRIRKIINNVDGIILHDEELIKHLPESDTPVYIVPLRLDVSRFLAEYPAEKEETPIIVHAPSKRGFKGTEFVLKAIEQLGDKVQFILVEKKTQKEALEIYKSADIIIDQLLAGTYGVFAIECMALGKPVITYVDADMLKTFPDELPILSANVYNIKEKIDELVCDSSRRRRIGKDSRVYVEKYHDCIKNASVLKKIYSGQCPVKRGKKAFYFADEMKDERK